MLNSLGNFHFKPTEEELEIRRKLEEERKTQSGVTNKEKSNNNNNNAQDTSKSSSDSAKSSSSTKTTKSTTATTAAAAKNTNEENKQDDRQKNTASSSSSKNNTGKSKIETSSYYFSKSTDPEKAKQFKPKKIDEQTAQETEREKAAKTAGSLWNTGSTMEEYDYSEWIHQRLKEELLKVEFKAAAIKINEVEDIGGTATYLFARGKLRAGWDLNFKAKWKGTVDGKEVEGSIVMEDITDSDDSDEWEFQAGAQKSDSEHEKGRRIVVNEKKYILKAIEVVLSEFKARKGNK